jgi:hypothetical protein
MMTLTTQELQQINDLEEDISRLQILVSNIGSKNSLNQLYILVQETVRKLDVKLTVLETKVDTLVEKVNKLQ